MCGELACVLSVRVMRYIGWFEAAAATSDSKIFLSFFRAGATGRASDPMRARIGLIFFFRESRRRPLIPKSSSLPLAPSLRSSQNFLARFLTTDCQSDTIPAAFVISASFRPRRHAKKQGGQVPASVVAGIYLRKMKVQCMYSIDFFARTERLKSAL